VQAKLDQSRQRNALSKGASAIFLGGLRAYNVGQRGRENGMDMNETF
jgi:hypothetical protein